MAKMTFEQWKRIVDSVISSKVGLSSDDLPDWSYYDAYTSGVSPSVAASRAIRNAKDY